MKYFLLKLAILAYPYHSCVNALDGPVLRGSTDVLVVLQDQCRDGKKAGEIAVGNIWKNAPFKSNCDNIWKLDEAIQKLIDEEFPDNTGSAKKDSYNECARKYGIEPQVQLIKKSCVGDDTTPCIKLGEKAATKIAHEYCPNPRPEPYSSPGNYLQECRNLGITICKGTIYGKIEFLCPGDMPSTSGLNHLMEKCEEKVDSMITSSSTTPTKKPSQDNRDGKYQCSKDKMIGPFPPGSFCFKARQDCCSSQRKYEKWMSFCTYYGLPKPDYVLPQGIIAPQTFTSVDIIDCNMCGYAKCLSPPTRTPTRKEALPGSSICSYAPNIMCWPKSNGWPKCCITNRCVSGVMYPCDTSSGTPKDAFEWEVAISPTQRSNIDYLE